MGLYQEAILHWHEGCYSLAAGVAKDYDTFFEQYLSGIVRPADLSLVDEFPVSWVERHVGSVDEVSCYGGATRAQ